MPPYLDTKGHILQETHGTKQEDGAGFFILYCKECDTVYDLRLDDGQDTYDVNDEYTDTGLGQERFGLMYALYKGRWEQAFIDPVQQRRFQQFVRAILDEGHDGFLVRYDFGTDDTTAWVHLTFVGTKPDPDGRGFHVGFQPEGISFPGPEATAETKTRAPSDLAHLPVFQYEWPEVP